MGNVKVSVIIPVYNTEPYLEKCIDSVVNQTLRDIEIIIIDDGSSDGSPDICKRYLNDPRVIYYRKENEGLAAARADGMARASGEFIGFIDSDDWAEPNMFEKMYNSAVSTGSDIVYCNKIYGENGHHSSPDFPAGVYDRAQILSDILPRSLAYIGPGGGKRVIGWSNCRHLYKKEMLDSFGFSFDRRFRRSQDLQLTYEAVLHSERFCNLSNEYLYHVRVVENSLARGYTKNMWQLYIPLIERLYKDTSEFKELDLTAQMHLRCFFFVTDCIDNEFKPTCTNDRETKIGIISEIMEHPLAQRFYGKIDVSGMNELYRNYYDLIHEKDAEKLVDYTEKYLKKQAREKELDKAKRSVMNFLTESAVVGTVYKKLRHKK